MDVYNLSTLKAEAGGPPSSRQHRPKTKTNIKNKKDKTGRKGRGREGTERRGRGEGRAHD